MKVPAVVTVVRVLRDVGLQQRVLRRRSGGLSPAPAHLTPTERNDLWTVDFKGVVARQRRDAVRAAHRPGRVQPVRPVLGLSEAPRIAVASAIARTTARPEVLAFALVTALAPGADALIMARHQRETFFVPRVRLGRDQRVGC